MCSESIGSRQTRVRGELEKHCYDSFDGFPEYIRNRYTILSEKPSEAGITFTCKIPDAKSASVNSVTARCFHGAENIYGKPGDRIFESIRNLALTQYELSMSVSVSNSFSAKTFLSEVNSLSRGWSASLKENRLDISVLHIGEGRNLVEKLDRMMSKLAQCTPW